MDDLNQVILNSLQELVGEIQQNIDRSGKTTTGKAKREIEIQSDGFNYKVLGVPYFNTLEDGREGGNVPKGFYYLIKDWAINKGLFQSTDRDLSRFAYFTSRKIANYGTEQYRLGKRTDIYTNTINNFIDTLTDKVSDFYMININKML